MSADNGVYILSTADGQYRVSTFQAVDNLYYDQLRPDNNDLNSLQVVMQYGTTKYTKHYDRALVIAGKILKKLFICEYGIQLIKSDKTWKTLCEEAQQDAKTILATDVKPYQDITRIRQIANGEITYDTENS